MTEKQFGVFYQNQPLDSDPTYFIPLTEARRLKAENQGYFCNSGQSFRLFTKVSEPDEEKLVQALKARDRSAQMPPSITEQYVDGHKGAVAIVEAWAWIPIHDLLINDLI